MKARAIVLALVCVAALPRPGRADVEKLRRVVFPTSCDGKVQAAFERGVALLHSYWFAEARRAFEAVLGRDPACVMAYWGLAVNYLGNPLASAPPPRDVAAASEGLQRARALGVRTARERDWIEAIGAYYRGGDGVPVAARLAAYTEAMAEMTRRYPDDFEAWVYYALALQASAPPHDKSYASQLQSAAILERLVAMNPEHPGAAHYLIHAYDYPPLAHRGIRIAGQYAKIAPAAPHARHMPSHIYSMVGMWEDSIAANRRALDAQADYHHATDFLVYAHLQLAQDVQARTLVDAIAALPRREYPILANYTAVAAIPARYALERGDWTGAAALPVVSTGRAMADSLVRFARGLGMARSGDLAGARREGQALRELGSALEKAGLGYWAERTAEQTQAIEAWTALAQGAREEAARLMGAAADGEDGSVKHVAMENRLYPMRELLGELLLELGRPAKALVELDASLAENPNRYRGLATAARAAEAAGDRPRAAAYFEKLLALASRADTPRPELAYARAFLGQR
jgi:tetratricopeptide (TPR) repeat protein